MSKLNKLGQVTPQTIVAKTPGVSLKYSANGNLQFSKTAKQRLYELAVGTLYGNVTDNKQSSATLVQALKDAVKDVVAAGELDFVANVAIYARTEMNIRTMPIILVVEFARELRAQGQSYEYMRSLVCDVIRRADQITDLYAYALSVFGNKKAIPTAIKRGVADAFNKFNEYGFAKYSRKTEVKFRDVLRIVHPKCKSKAQGELFQKIMEDKLETPYTWETVLSTEGQKPEHERKSKAVLWKELIQSGEMGYMATIRNLRNMVEAGVPAQNLQYVANYIADANNVAKSKMLSFDFIEAYEAIYNRDANLKIGVEKAIDAACSNIPKLGNNVWIMVDYSSSMGGSESTTITTANMFTAGIIKAAEATDNVAVTLFGTNAISFDASNIQELSVVHLMGALLSNRRGDIAGSTNFEAALNQKNKLGFKPETIIVITDGDVNYFPYGKLHNFCNDAIKVTVNMNSAASTPFIKENGWIAISGWSTAIFKYIGAIRDKNTIIDQLSQEYAGVS
jgi:60 kDa SS-A/Ro ribonucleoprotein